MQIEKRQLELYMEQLTGSKLRNEYKALYSHPVYLTYMQSTSQAGIKIAGRNNLRSVDDTILMAESEE